jgi:hypothetical protein
MAANLLNWYVLIISDDGDFNKEKAGSGAKKLFSGFIAKKKEKGTNEPELKGTEVDLKAKKSPNKGKTAEISQGKAVT